MLSPYQRVKMKIGLPAVAAVTGRPMTKTKPNVPASDQFLERQPSRLCGGRRRAEIGRLETRTLRLTREAVELPRLRPLLNGRPKAGLAVDDAAIEAGC